MRGDIRLDGLALARRDGSRSPPRNGSPSRSTASTCSDAEARIASVAVEAPAVDVMRLDGGSLELGEPLFDTASDAVARPAAAAPEKPWSVTVAKVAVTHGALALADATSGFRTTLVDVQLDATSLSTRAGEKAHVKLAFVSADRIATF